MASNKGTLLPCLAALLGTNHGIGALILSGPSRIPPRDCAQ
jgi:hypothetical protein